MPNSVVFARSLYALHEAGVLRKPECKSAVKIFIRQSSEGKHWHLSAHYRSVGAQRIIEAAASTIRTAPQYHAFCCKRANALTHEHMVPGEVVYELITTHPRPSVLAFARILKRTGYRATITQTENSYLLPNSVPDLKAFKTAGSTMYFDHKCRYTAARGRIELVARPNEGWFK
jgi:hypothetical protein